MMLSLNPARYSHFGRRKNAAPLVAPQAHQHFDVLEMDMWHGENGKPLVAWDATAKQFRVEPELVNKLRTLFAQRRKQGKPRVAVVHGARLLAQKITNNKSSDSFFSIATAFNLALMHLVFQGGSDGMAKSCTGLAKRGSSIHRDRGTKHAKTSIIYGPLIHVVEPEKRFPASKFLLLDASVCPKREATELKPKDVRALAAKGQILVVDTVKTGPWVIFDDSRLFHSTTERAWRSADTMKRTPGRSMSVGFPNVDFPKRTRVTRPVVVKLES